MVVGRLEHRRLEVVVLSARGLPQPDPQAFSLGEGRRKVQLTLVSPRDPEGEAFGAKVSPWTEPAATTRGVRFGRAGLGLACSFPLDATSGAPSAAADPRFPEAARLRVRLLSSRVPSQNSALKAVTGLLPAAFANGVSHELDEATAQVEAEALIPLANIVSGRVGFAADRALGGWVPLRQLGVDDPLATGQDDVPLSLWMQMYVLPDHESMRPTIKAQLEHELAKGSGGAGLPARSAGPGGLAPAPPRDFAQVAAATGTEPRWGPAASPSRGAATVPDLIDVALDDEPVGGGAPAAGAGLLDLLGEEAAGEPAPPALPRLGELPVVGGLDAPGLAAPASASGGSGSAFGFVDASPAAGPAGLASAFGFLAAASAAAPSPAGSAGGALGSPAAGSAFGFVAAGPQPSGAPSGGSGASAFGFLASSPPAAAGAPAGPSAFGFIGSATAAGAPASLDLAALYKDPGKAPPANRPLKDFSALTELGPDGRPLVESASASPPSYSAGLAGEGASGKSLQSLEACLVAGLSSSLRT